MSEVQIEKEVHFTEAEPQEIPINVGYSSKIIIFGVNHKTINIKRIIVDTPLVTHFYLLKIMSPSEILEIREE